MVSALNKIVKPQGQEPDELEHQVAQAFFDLETNVPDLRAELMALHFASAKEVGYTFMCTREEGEESGKEGDGWREGGRDRMMERGEEGEEEWEQMIR